MNFVFNPYTDRGDKMKINIFFFKNITINFKALTI